MHTPSTWSFLCYRNDAGRNLIYSHLSALSKQGMMNLRRTLEHLRVKPQTSWDRPQASPLGNHMYVIRLEDENRTQHRLFGHHEIPRQAFVITLYGIEKDSHCAPSNYIALCPCRQCECLADPGTHKCACLEHVDALFPSWPSPHQPQPRLDARPRKTRLGSTQPSHQPGGHLGHVLRLCCGACKGLGSGFQTTQEIALRN